MYPSHITVCKSPKGSSQEVGESVGDDCISFAGDTLFLFGKCELEARLEVQNGTENDPQLED